MCVLTPIATMLTKFHEIIAICAVEELGRSDESFYYWRWIIQSLLIIPLDNLAFEKIQLLIIAYRLPHNEIHNLQLAALLSLYCFASYLFELWVWFGTIEASVYMSAPTYLYCVQCNSFPPWCSRNAQFRLSFAVDWTLTHFISFF